MLNTAEVGLFHLPVGYPRATLTTKPPTKKEVKEWFEEKNPSTLEKTSYGTYVGIAAMVIGAASWLVGFIKDNWFGKWVGGILASSGAVATFVGKCCGVENDLVNSLRTKALYNPPTELETTPDKEGIPCEEVFIGTTDGEKLYGYYLPSPKETKKTVIYLHGRANNISHCLKDIKELQEKAPVNVLICDYRGFGKSTLNTGEINRNGIITDAKAMHDYLIQKRGCNSDDISLFGHSLGGAVAIELAKQLTKEKKPPHAMVIQDSFTSIRDVPKDRLNIVFPSKLANLLSALISNEFDSKKSIKEIDPKIQVLISHGTNDWVIPFKQSQELHKEIPGTNKKLILLEGAGHSDFCEHLNPEYVSTLQQLIAA